MAKIAIVHDWLVGGGSERVVSELHKMYPAAPIYTSYCDPKLRTQLDNKVVTGYLQYWPFSLLRKFLPVLRIWWFTHLDLSDYDLVISSSGNGEAKGIRLPKSTLHISYIHTPTHFYWRHYENYLKQPGFGLLNPLARFGLKLLVKPLRNWDYRAAQRPDYLIANSSHIQADIKKYYHRDSVVIHPPVDTERFNKIKDSLPRSGFVTVGRQVPLKHIDVIIAACNQLNLKLKVIGSGPEHKKLTKMAGPTIEFLTSLSDSEVAKAVATSEAFIFAGFEDFGISPVEAMAAGVPVIGYKAGGTLDYIIPGKTGEFFDQLTVHNLVEAIKSFDPKHYDPKTIKHQSEQFSRVNFREKISDFIQKITT